MLKFFFTTTWRGHTRFDTPNLALARTFGCSQSDRPDAWERLLCILPVAWKYLMTSNTSTFHYLIYGQINLFRFVSATRKDYSLSPKNHQTRLVRCMFLLSMLSRPFVRTGNCQMAAQCHLPMISLDLRHVHLLLLQGKPSDVENRFGKIGGLFGHTCSVAVARSMHWDHQSLLWSATGTDCSGTSNDCSTVLVMSTSAIDRFYDSLTQALTCILLLQEVYLVAHLSRVWPVWPVWPKILGAWRLW
jgi:hypothetical protein